jgi:hypothetical protein
MSVEMKAEIAGGSLGTPQLNYDEYLVSQDAFHRAVERGRVYATCQQGTGVVTQAGLSGTDAILALHNPAGSGVTGRLWHCSFISKVAAAAAMVAWLAVNANVVAAIVTGTAAVVRNLKLGGGESNNQGQALLALTTATLPAAPVAILQLGLQLTEAVTGSFTLLPFYMPECFAGAILIQPGTTLSFQTSTASGAAGCHGCFVWEECPLLS